MTTKILVGDALETLKTLPSESVHCIITSPPYYGLRDYNVDGQLGLESTPEEFLANMVEVFREARRVLRADGVCFVNMGDSYNANTGKGFNGQKRYDDANRNTKRPSVLPAKNLLGMPWRLALALQADGWWLRSDIIWAKPNPMPESVTDRPTKAHEYVFLLTKSARYFYDAEAVREEAIDNKETFYKKLIKKPHKRMRDEGGKNETTTGFQYATFNPAGRNRRTVWTIATQPFSAAHFATFPTKLVEPMIKAGTSEKGCCPECGAPWERVTEKTKYTPPIAANGERFVDETRGDKTRKLSGSDYNKQVKATTTGWRPTCDHDHDPIPGTVLDPFAGACTVGLVADRLGRDSIMIELNPEYAAMGRQRIKDDAGWVADIEVEETAVTQGRLL